MFIETGVNWTTRSESTSGSSKVVSSLQVLYLPCVTLVPPIICSTDLTTLCILKSLGNEVIRNLLFSSPCYFLSLKPNCSPQNLPLTSFLLAQRPGIRSRYSNCLKSRRPGVRIQAGTRDFLFSKTVQTGSGAHPAFYSMGTGVLSQG